MPSTTLIRSDDVEPVRLLRRFAAMAAPLARAESAARLGAPHGPPGYRAERLGRMRVRGCCAAGAARMWERGNRHDVFSWCPTERVPVGLVTRLSDKTPGASDLRIRRTLD